MIARFSSRVIAIAVLLGIFCVPAAAARVPATKLLPKKTLAYLRVADVPQLVEAFQQTNLGRMLADPQIKPLVTELYTSANEALAEMREQLGVSLDELAKLPQGEITLALVPTETLPAMVVLVDCGTSIESARTMIGKLRGAMEQGGRQPQEEVIAGVTVTSYETGNRRRGQMVLLERDNAVALTSSLEAAKQLLARWTEGSDDCLGENTQFGAIMSRCKGAKDEAPHITFFLDPMTAAYELTKGNAGAQIALAIVPTLGIDGLKGIGGSITLSTDDYDLITHLHVLLDNPRAGILELIALDSGDNSPPAWTPADVNSYTSLHWNFEQTFTKGAKLADSFGVLGGARGAATTVNDQTQAALGVSFEQDLLPALTGRVVLLNWFEKPAKLGVGPANLVGVQLKDPQTFGATLDKMVAKFAERVEKKTAAGVTYYQQVVDLGPDEVRPVPCFAVMDDWLLIADQATFLQHVLARRTDAENSLATALDYKLIASKIGRQPGGSKPGMLSFNRPEEGLKHLHELATSDQTRTMLRDSGQSNRFLQVLGSGLEKNPLPPYTVLSRYLAPGGSMIVDDETGIHYLGFSLRRK